jgi:hypothetical protein
MLANLDLEPHARLQKARGVLNFEGIRVTVVPQ